MKKKNKQTAGSKTRSGISGNDSQKRSKTTAGSSNTGGHSNNNEGVTGNDGNIYGENEEDFYSHAPGA
jgi:hypothetical protein